MNKINNVEVIRFITDGDLIAAKEFKNDKCFIYGLVGPDCDVSINEIQNDANIVIEGGFTERVQEELSDLVRKVFESDNSIDLNPDDLVRLDEKGVQGTISFGSSAEELINNKFGKIDFEELKKVQIAVIVKSIYPLKKIGAIIESIYSHMEEGIEVYFDRIVDNSIQDIKILIIGI